MTDDATTRVVLTLAPAPGRGGPDLMVRLRRALKALLRRYGWRVVAAAELPPLTSAPAGGGGPPREGGEP